jgi:hypothetical protein
VIEPTSVNMVIYARRHVVNRPDIGMTNDIYLAPDTVNFSAVSFEEEQAYCLATGVYAFFNGAPHEKQPTAIPLTDTVVPGLGTLAAGRDNIYSGDPGSGVQPPFTPGTEVFMIPWDFRVGTNPWKTFINLDQNCSLANGGVLTISKGGASWSCNVTSPTVP